MNKAKEFLETTYGVFECGGVSLDEAYIALDEIDDCLRMGIEIVPTGPMKVMLTFLKHCKE